VAFEGNLTLTAAPVTFEGAAFFADGVVVTMSAPASTITLKSDTIAGVDAATLGAGPDGALAIGEVPTSSKPYIYQTALIASGTDNVVLTPEGGETLTFATAGTITQTGSISIAGTAAVIPLKSYIVATSGTLTVTGTLDLDAGTLAPYNSYATGGEADWVAKLVLSGDSGSGALLKGSGTVVAGGTTITGATAGWQAATGSANVTIAKDAISAASGATLTAQDADAAITVTASRLAVTGEIVLASGTKGKLILKGDDTTAGSLLLKGHANNAGKLRVAADSNTVKVGDTVTNSDFLIFAASGMSPTTQAYVTAADGTKVTPDNLSVNGGNADASSGTTLSSINAGNEADTKDVLITGQTAEANALTIISGAYVKVSNSDA
jgi:hypothetical protein